MKKSIYTLLGLLLVIKTMAQTKSDFYGKWQVMEQSENWLLEKTGEEPRWGKFFEFHEDGTYTERASAPCGLDDNRYSYVGKWTYDLKTAIIKLYDIEVMKDRPNIYNHYQALTSGSFKIVSNKKGALEIKVINYWEKVTNKKQN